MTITLVDGEGTVESTTIEKTQLPSSYPITFITGLENALNGKVGRVAGKGLSSNDFTDALKAKLEALATTVTVPVGSVGISELKEELKKMDVAPSSTGSEAEVAVDWSAGIGFEGC